MEPLHTGPIDTVDTHAPSGRQGQTIDMRAIASRAVRMWYLFLLFPLILGSLGYLYLRYDVEEFRVRSVIQIIESTDDRALAELTTSINGGLVADNKASLTNQIEILNSYYIMRSVVDSFDLDVVYFVEGKILNDELYHAAERPFDVVDYESNGQDLYEKELLVRLDSNDADFTLTIEGQDPIRGMFGQRVRLPYGTVVLDVGPGNGGSKSEVKVVIYDPIKRARDYRAQLDISAVGASELLELSMLNSIPERAIDIIGGVISRYDQMTISEKNEVADKTTAFVNDRLNYLAQELDEVEAAAESYIVSNDIVGGTSRGLDQFFERLRANEQRIGALRLESAAIDQVERTIQEAGQDSLTYLPYDISLANINLGPLITQYNQLLVERERLLLSARPGNPVLRPVNQNISELRAVLTDALAEARRGLRERTEELTSDTDNVLNQIRTIPSKERGLMAIERQQEIREQLYLYLLQRREETALSSAAAVSNIRILEEPLQYKASNLGPLEVYGLAILLGLLLPVGLVSVVEIMDDTVRSSDQIKELTAAPFLGQIAENEADDHIVVTTQSRSAIAEMFRMLRTNLQFMISAGDHQVLLVTSSVSGEGKTYICTNLGISLALSDKRVVLLGMDLRRPRLGSYLSEESEEGKLGISNYLTGNATLDDVIQQASTNSNVHYITSGAVPPNPAELLMLPKVGEMMAELRRRYDYVLIDTPPVGLVTDAMLLRDHIDISLYVTRFGMTHTGQLNIVEDLRRNNKLPNVGIVLNGVKTGVGYGGYGYGYGGYGYGYGYGDYYA